jgi:cytoskeletal protein CcmA (bactofilin family)
VSLGGWLATAHAQTFHTGSNVSTPVGGTVNSSLFIAGQSVNVSGTVRGDVFCAGQNVHVSATVLGDVLCAGQNLTVDGKVSGDVRLAGQSVSLGATVGGNATIFAQDLTQESGAKVGGDMTISGHGIRLNGPVGRDVAVAADNLTIASSVGRNVQARVQQLTLSSGAYVGGSINYTSEHTLARASGVDVDGSITRHPPPAARHTALAVSLLWLLYIFLALLLTALLLVLLVPWLFHAAAEAARGRLLRTFLIGLVASIVVPVLLLALALTIVGLPLALLLGLAWLLVMLLSLPFAAYLLGRILLHRKTDSAIWTMLLGAAVLVLLSFVPFLDILTSLAAYWFGLGVILQYVAYLPKPHYHMGRAERSAEPPDVAS